MTGTLAAIGPDGELAYYLAIGMVATVNPCGFAMLPAYLSYFMGLDGGADGEPEPDGGLRRAARVALAVSAGFVAVFAVAGLAVKLSSLPVYEVAPWISVVIGVALAALGVAMLAGYEPRLRWLPLPSGGRAGRERTVRAMFVFGASYAVASVGCTLPTFLVAVSGTMERESLLDGLLVFALYAAGMALVLTALTVSMALARTSVLRALRSAQPYIHSISAVLVILAGLYVAYYGLLEARLNGDGPGVPSSGVVDVVTGWSHDASELIRSIGAVEIGLAVAAAVALGLAWTARPRRDP
ncbi:MAG TPA: cytochrome c biogenesis CcdA family protein [Acidimicrobiales bacterium]